MPENQNSKPANSPKGPESTNPLTDAPVVGKVEASAPDTATATAVLINAIHIAQQRGAYSLEESANIHMAMQILQKK